MKIGVKAKSKAELNTSTQDTWKVMRTKMMRSSGSVIGKPRDALRTEGSGTKSRSESRTDQTPLPKRLPRSRSIEANIEPRLKNVGRHGHYGQETSHAPDPGPRGTSCG